jgi:hypothetical protein
LIEFDKGPETLHRHVDEFLKWQKKTLILFFTETYKILTICIKIGCTKYIFLYIFQFYIIKN